VADTVWLPLPLIKTTGDYANQPALDMATSYHFTSTFAPLLYENGQKALIFGSLSLHPFIHLTSTEATKAPMFGHVFSQQDKPQPFINDAFDKKN